MFTSNPFLDYPSIHIFSMRTIFSGTPMQPGFRAVSLYLVTLPLRLHLVFLRQQIDDFPLYQNVMLFIKRAAAKEQFFVKIFYNFFAQPHPFDRQAKVTIAFD